LTNCTFPEAGIKASEQFPFVFLNLALTADGKLAPANRQFLPFGSRRDQTHMLELRATADAVMSGARTVGTGPVTLGPGPAKYRRLRLKRGLAEYNLRVVVSGGGSLDPGAEVFKRRFSPVIVLTTGRAPRAKIRQWQALGAEVKVCGDRAVDFKYALTWLREQWNVQRLLCEGGGEVNAALFRAGLVREVHLTLCPVIMGGRAAPTAADGQGFETLADATRLRVKSRRRVGDEMFLVYEVEGAAAERGSATRSIQADERATG
jgi:riboflavin-specific deaminase-like protein